jgi:uncharacterized protein (UPF0332 family)
MNLEELLEENKIEKIEKKEFDGSLAERDLKAARDSFNSSNFDWALSIAYNAVLQAGRALMFHLGYRPRGKNQHKTVFEFLLSTRIDNELADYFDAVRKTRHVAVYEESGYVSKNAAEEAIKQAGLFVQKIKTFVHKIRTENDI